MKIRSHVVTVLFAATLVIGPGCGSDDGGVGPDQSNPVQMLANPGVEDGSGAPEHWSFSEAGTPPGNDYLFEWSEAESHSGSRSLMIGLGSVQHGGAFAHWNQSIDSGIPHGKKLTLEVAVKTLLSGAGAGFMVRVDDENGPVTWATTQGVTEITGVEDWRVFSTSLESVPGEVTKIWVFLILFPNTTGTVFFDDIELTYR
jgi:hypothetical protein